MDPFYRELERAEEERNKRKEDEKDAREEKDRQREEVITPQASRAIDDERANRRSSMAASSATTGTSRRSSAVSTPSNASLFSPSHPPHPSSASSRRMSRHGDSLPAPSGSSNHNSRAPSRSSLSANGLGSTKQRTRMLAGRGGQTPASEREGRVTGLPAVVLVGNGGRRRLDKQLAMVRRSVEEVEANMKRKMEREKEKDRERIARELRATAAIAGLHTGGDGGRSSRHCHHLPHH